MLDLTARIIIIIGGSLFITAVFLIAVVAYLFFQVSKVLKPEKECGPEANAANTMNKVTLAETTATEFCPVFHPCDECTMYADPLTPCFCDINEEF